MDRKLLRLSSDIVHELTNALFCLSLNLEDASAQDREKKVQTSLKRSLRQAKHLQCLLSCLQRPRATQQFSPYRIIEDVACVFSLEAAKLRIRIKMGPKKEVRIKGSPLIFQQRILRIMEQVITPENSGKTIEIK